MKNIVCNFAPIRFLPYRETEEFVNVGVVIHCPQVDFFGFRLETKKTRRVTDFFPELEANLLKKALSGIHHELKTLPMTRTDLEQFSKITPLVSEQLIDRFCELVRVREGILHFGPMGTRLVENPQEGVDELFDHYVERQFAKQPEYQEKVMKVRLYQILKQWKVSRYFKKDEIIGDDEYHVTMPFVHFRGMKVERVIRPLNLSQETPSEIIDHAGTWIGRMDRLKKRGQLPQKVIFPVKLPTEGKRAAVARDLCHELEVLGIKAIPLTENLQDLQNLQAIVVEGLEDVSPEK